MPGASPHQRLERAWARTYGAPAPLGATWIEGERAFNFALYSRNATGVSLLCYAATDAISPVLERALDPANNKTGRVWHCRVTEAEMGAATLYGYRVDGPNRPATGDRFDRLKVILDPYARGVFFPSSHSRAACIAPGPTDGRAPLGVLPARSAPNGPTSPPLSPQPRHGHDAVVYEMHVRGFTQRANSGVSPEARGTFAGLVQKIPYLQDLGVTIVELLPVHQFDPQEEGGQYWGYMTLNFFSPHGDYASDADAAAEFRTMVDAFHAAGIEVWLDVVYNHTTEKGSGGPTYSLRGIDNSTYYLLDPNNRAVFIDVTGCQNTTRTSHPATRQLVVDSLDYWANDLLVDGFRFDLASALTRNDDGSINLNDPPVIAEIGFLAERSAISVIAEAWDTQTYQLGRSFPGIDWRQWNGQFRDDVRAFVKGDSGVVGAVMQRLYGSDWLFPDGLPDSHRPYQSINYVDSHDGLCLNDLVAYTRGNQRSWDCGWSGELNVPAAVERLRRRQVKNFCALLMLANGTPMFVAGDEFMNSQGGNDNPYNQDNTTTWLDWDRLTSHQDVYRFFKLMIGFRKAHPSIGRYGFWRGDVSWHGVGPQPDLSDNSHTLAYLLRGAPIADDDLYVMINAHWEPLDFSIQADQQGGEWLRVVDTSLDSPADISEPGSETRLQGSTYGLGPRSVVVLRRSS
jgi:isoamylase